MTGNTITITTLGHACVLLEFSRESSVVRMLLDPGNLTAPLELKPVDAVLVTHAHPDHVDPEQLSRLRPAGERLQVYGADDVRPLLGDATVDFTAILPGRLDIAGIEVDVRQTPHEPLYADLPLPVNYGYTFDGRVYAGGDSLRVPEVAVDVLLAPLAGPWMKLADGIDFLRAVAPARVIPVHDGGLAPAHRALHRGLFAKFAESSTTFIPLDPGQSITV